MVSLGLTRSASQVAHRRKPSELQCDSRVRCGAGISLNRCSAGKFLNVPFVPGEKAGAAKSKASRRYNRQRNTMQYSSVELARCIERDLKNHLELKRRNADGTNFFAWVSIPDLYLHISKQVYSEQITA